MPTLGEELKRRREERGVSLNDISEATRIGTRFLKAIETDNFSILPGGIYTRNFIRAFAEQVGMAEDEAIALYHQQVSGQSVDPGAQAAPPKRPLQPVELPSRRIEPITYRQGPSRTNWSTVIIGIGIALFLALIILAVVKKMEQGPGQSQTADGDLATPGETPQPPPAPPSSPDNSNQQAATPQTPTPEVPPTGSLRVKLEATGGDSYVRYQTDDAKPVALIIKQGQSQEIPPAQNQIKLIYGNRLALKLMINDREARFPENTPKFSGQIVISRETLDSYFQ
jgi:cytoskeletal protein RodZ